MDAIQIASRGAAVTIITIPKAFDILAGRLPAARLGAQVIIFIIDLAVVITIPAGDASAAPGPAAAAAAGAK